MKARAAAAALLLGAPGALAQAPASVSDPGLGFPQFAGEADLRLYGLGTHRADNARRRGVDAFLRGEIAAGLHLAPEFSIQGLIHIEPVGETEPKEGVVGFRHQAAYLESLFLDWRPVERLGLFAGKFSAPFGYGHHAFPGILPRVRAHETYLIRESVGVGARWTFLSDARWGEHDLTAAVFTLDTSFLSNTLITRERCCTRDFERYARNTRAGGGAGNTGRLNNFAIALDGDRIGWLPNFTYHLALLSRGAGRNGTAREWGYAIGAQYGIAWDRRTRTLLFAEHVEFRNAGGRPLEAPGEEPEAAEVPVSERRRFTTLGARTTHGPWRATLAWQRDQRKRPASPVPTETWLEVSAGRELGWGFGLDLGYQQAWYAREEGGRGESGAVVGMLSWRGAF